MGGTVRAFPSPHRFDLGNFGAKHVSRNGPNKTVAKFNRATTPVNHFDAEKRAVMDAVQRGEITVEDAVKKMQQAMESKNV